MDYTNILNAINSKLGSILELLQDTKISTYIQVIIAIILIKMVIDLGKGI